METDSLIAAIALAASLVTFGAVTLAEAGIASVRRERVQAMVSQGVSGAVALDRLHTLPMGPTGSLSMLRTVSMGGALVSAVALAVATDGVRWPLIGLVSVAVLGFLGVLYLTCKSIAAVYGERIATLVAVPARAVSWVANPTVAGQAMLLGTLTSRKTASGVGGAEPLPLPADGEPLDEREVRMIRGVVRLDTTTAREIMVPRVDMVTAEMGTSIADLAEQMASGGHSRVPITNGDLDHIRGIVYARDILRHLVEGASPRAVLEEDLVRDPLFIPEAKTLEELLNEFQEKRVHMAIVVDEYGGVAGLVTIEDLLEEIVGEIRDEFDVGEPEIQPVNDTEFIMDARVGIDQLNELLGVFLEGDGFDTIGGFVYQRLGRIPSPGDAVEYDGLSIEVVSTTGRRLQRLRVTRSASTDPLAS